MAQPTAYVPAHSFVADSATLANFPGQALDVEFQDVKTTTDQIRNQLALIQRDDSSLANGVVTYESLSTSLQAVGIQPATAWVTATTYQVGNSAVQNSSLYRCLVLHTSSVFATDLAAAKWVLVSSLAYSAGTNITFNGSVISLSTPLVTPNLGVATAASINGNVFTSGTYTLTGAAGKTFTFSNTLTLSGTDGTAFSFPPTSDTVVTLAATQALTNKTLTSPTITSSTTTGTPTINGSLAINPTANSRNQGFLITQSSPTSGSVAGPTSFNQVDLNYQGAVTGATQVAALRINVNTGGANLSGGPVMGGYFNMLNSIAGSVAVVDKIGLVGSFLGTIADAAGGGGYGLNAFSGVTATGSINRLVGMESDIEIRAGGSATYRYAISAVNESLGVGTGSTLDSAFLVGNIGNATGAFLNGMVLSGSLGAIPLAATANWFSVDAALTIANVLNLTNLTVSGNIITHTNATLTGAGALTIAGNLAANAVLTNTVNDSTNSKNLVSRSGTTTRVGNSNILSITDAGVSTFTGSILSSSGTAGIGYSTGSGGTVLQGTSKANGVTLDKTNGTITMNGAALNASTTVSFILTDSTIAATDVVVVNVTSGNVTTGTYNVWAEKASPGQVNICLRNISAGSLSEAIVLQFIVIKSVAA